MSIDAYYKLELEKKKMRSTKSVHKGPMIRYVSVTMPELPNSTDPTAREKHSRNFVTFPDDTTMKSYFNSQKPKSVQNKYCVITGLPAKYFDPATKCAYANFYAYKALKELHAAKIAKSEN